jgi:hypothetical protein
MKDKEGIMRKGIVRLIVSLFCSLSIMSCGGGGSNSQPTTNHAPVSFAGPNQNIATGTLVTLDGTGSYDEDGDPLTYSWAFTNVPAGSTAVLSNATSSRPTFVPNVSGNYVARLIVNDGKAETGKTSDEDPRQEMTSEASYVTITASITPPPSEGDNQLWKLESVGGGYYRIVAKHSNKVLDVEGASISPGTQVNQYTYNGGDHQKFSTELWVSSGIYGIRVKQTGLGYAYLCLGVENDSLADRAKVQQQLCGWSSNASQMWYFIDNRDGYYKIKNYKSGKCMDVKGASLADKANVQQFTCY